MALTRNFKQTATERGERDPAFAKALLDEAAVIQDIASDENTQKTLTLLKILALGNQEIETGKVTLAAEVARRLKAKKTAAA